MAAIQDPDSPPAADDLNDAERELLEAAATGKMVDLRTGDEDLDTPASAADWDDGRNVHADFLADLLTGDRPTSTGRLRFVKLRGARITGTLDLEARKLLCPVLLKDCYFDKAINLYEAEAVSIYLPGCHIPGINAEQLRTVGNVWLNDGFTVTGETQLAGTHIGGQLVLRGASLTNNGLALDAGGLSVDRDLICDGGATVTGEIRLAGAHVGGQLTFSGASLTNNSGRALDAGNLTVDRDLICDGGFTVQGEMSLLGCYVGGHFDLSGASLTNNSGVALNADGITVDREMHCNDGFTAIGETRLAGAHVGGQLTFSGASLTNDSGRALDADGITVDREMLCNDGFTAIGETRLVSAHIGGHFDLRGASLTSDNGAALTANGLTVDRSMFCSSGFTARGVVRLTNAKVGVFYDDFRSWPDRLRIGGFTYDGLGDQSVGSRARLQWLRRHDGPFTPQIYDQLADVYRRAGEVGSARKVAIAKQWRRRKPHDPLSWLWYVTVGYGYRTWQAFIWAAVLTAIGALVFSGAYPAHMVKMTAHPPRFQPVIYTLDVLLPIGGLGQKSAWQPTGGYLDWYWILAIAGWVLTAAVVAGLTGILKRD